MLPTRRRISKCLTNQENEDTCYAHSTAKVITRFLLIMDDSDFEETHEENCQELYRTVTCKDIFKCLEEIDCRNPQNIISALLFTLFYKIIIFNHGCDGGMFLESAMTVVIFITSSPTVNSIKKILGYQEKYKSLENYITIVQDLIIKSVDSMFDIDLVEIYITTDINVNNKNRIENIKEDVYKLINVLSFGFYACVTILGTSQDITPDGVKSHAMTIVGYNSGDWPYFLVKNSWGDNNDFEDIVVDGKLDLDVFISWKNIHNMRINNISYIIPNSIARIERPIQRPINSRNKWFRNIRKSLSRRTGIHHLISGGKKRKSKKCRGKKNHLKM